MSDPPSSRLRSYLRVPSLSSAVPQAPSICTRVLSARLPCFHVTQAELETPRFFMRLLILASSLGRMGKCGMLLSGLWLGSICPCLPEVRGSCLISGLNKFPRFYCSTNKKKKKAPLRWLKCTRNLGVLRFLKNPREQHFNNNVPTNEGTIIKTVCSSQVLLISLNCFKRSVTDHVIEFDFLQIPFILI